MDAKGYITDSLLDIKDLDRLYRAHSKELLAFIAQRYSPKSEAMDILHEVFYLAARRISSGKVTSTSPRTWLYRITSNLIISKYRQNGKEAVLSVIDEVGTENFEARLLNRMLYDSISKYVAQTCSKWEADIFELRTKHELQFEIIASIKKSSKSSVARVIQKINEKIRKKFREFA